MCGRFLLLPILLLVSRAALADTPSFVRGDVASVDGVRGIAVADFDQNGWADVAHANTGRNTVTILLNVNGSLTRSHDVAVGAGPFDIVAADFNRDGKTDLAVVTADANRWSTLYGRGDGTFAVQEFGNLGEPRGVTAADMNKDGRPDLVITNFVGGAVEVYVSTGNGFDSAGGFIGHGSRPQGVVARDFNHDGHMDMAVAYESAGSVAVIYGNGHPNGYRASGLPGAGTMNVITAADFNRDGWEDLAAASTGANQVGLYLGSPTGLRSLRTIATGASPRDIVAADVNLDGLTDLLTANHGSNTVIILLGTGDAGIVAAAISVPAGRGSRALAVADFDIDGRPDIATGNQLSSSATVLSNRTIVARAGYVFQRQPIGSEGGGSRGVAVADFNHDGRQDVASIGGDNASLSVLIAGGARVPLSVGGDWPRLVWAADLNKDGHEDVLLVRGLPMIQLRVYLGNGAGGFSELSPQSLGFPVASIDLKELTGDGDLDLVFARDTFRTPPEFQGLAVWRGDGAGRFWETGLLSGNGDLTIARVADVNGDGKNDIVAGLRSRDAEVWHGDATGRFVFAERIVRSDAPPTDRVTWAAVGDLNHDGFSDVLLSSFNRPSGVALGGPTGFAWSGALRQPGAELVAPELVDLNADGHLDAVSRFGSILPGTGDGTFQAADNLSSTGTFRRCSSTSTPTDSLTS